MLKYVFLTSQFYQDYAHCSEIEKKQNRPHIQVQISLGEQIFCIPMRSNINHPHVFWTDKANHCGLDFSKMVLITSPANYIDQTRTPIIRQNEFNALKGKEHVIEQKLAKYIRDYKAAKARMDLKRNRTLVRYSTLQYFEQYIQNIK